MNSRRPKLVLSVSLAIVVLLASLRASATNASPPNPAPVEGAVVLALSEHQRVVEVIFAAKCIDKHLPKAFNNRAEVSRLLTRYNFDEARFKVALKKRKRLPRFETELAARMSGCTPSLARELYAQVRN